MSGGAGGEGGELGPDASGGAAGERGGSGGKAGGGNGGGGTGGGGTGGGSTTCGNGTTEGTEACDDGNVDNFDGCASNCQDTCESCLDEFYSEDQDFLTFVEWCNNSTEKAVEGPSAGTLRSTLCQNLVKCIVSSGCAAAGAAAGAKSLHDACYCGAGVTAAECESGGPDKLGNPQGPCVREFGGAAEGKSPTEIINRLYNPTLGIGWAAALTGLGVGNGYCLDACTYGREIDACTRCAAGDEHTFSITATCAGGFDPEAHDAVALCVRQNCSAADLEPCYMPTGPCAAQLVAAGTRLAATQADLACRAQNCATECFKP
jgi:cysteine-rich repeat protein